MNIDAKKASAVTTAIIALIGVTPLCGVIFICGCTWPWSGFYFDCNYFHAVAERRCPWCASAFAGWFSVGLAKAFGMIASSAPLMPIRRCVTMYLLRIGAGILIFLVVAVLTGWFAARSQHYPFGLTMAQLTGWTVRD